MQDSLPKNVYDDIQKHLILNGNAAEDGWEAGQDEEDTLTGHLGAKLQTNWSSNYVLNGNIWRWRIRYKKFGGRGKGAFEKKSGADGIVQIDINNSKEDKFIQKGILFQAKKGDIRRSKKKLIEQVNKMEQIAIKSSAIFNYEENDYRCISGHEYLNSIKDKAIIPRDSNHRIGSFLGEQFLSCKSGLLGMYYDAMKRVLIIPDIATNRFLRLNLDHRISIDVVKY